MKIGVFFGSTMGNTERAAELIAEAFNADLHNVETAQADELLNYDVLICGTSTWGVSDLQDDWDFFLDDTEEIDISGKTVAFFGAGDQNTYTDQFIDAVSILHEKLGSRAKKIVGYWPAGEYHFSGSKALIKDKLMGLAIDEDNEPDLTNDRVKRWVKQLKEELGIN